MRPVDTQLGRVFELALIAELAGDQQMAFVWRRLFFALARDICGLAYRKHEFAIAEPPAPRQIMLADELLLGIRAALREPHNSDAQVLPRAWTLERVRDSALGCEFIYLVSPNGKRGRIVGIDADVVTDAAEIRLAIREAGKYNVPIGPSPRRRPAFAEGQLALVGC